jgi:transposase
MAPTLLRRRAIMSRRPQPIAPVPEETIRVARAALPNGNPDLTFREARGTIFQDTDVAPLCPLEGHPGLPPWRWARRTILQFREHLTARQAAEAVRARLDWKYLLGLECSDPGVDGSVLSACRDRWLESQAEALGLDTLLERCRALGWLPARGQQRTDSTHGLAAIRVLNRLALGAETWRAPLNELATVAPDWRCGIAPGPGYERDSTRLEAAHLPQAETKRHAYAQTGGADGCHLWDALEAPEAPAEVRALPLLET